MVPAEGAGGMSTSGSDEEQQRGNAFGVLRALGGEYALREKRDGFAAALSSVGSTYIRHRSPDAAPRSPDAGGLVSPPRHRHATRGADPSASRTATFGEIPSPPLSAARRGSGAGGGGGVSGAARCRVRPTDPSAMAASATRAEVSARAAQRSAEAALERVRSRRSEYISRGAARIDLLSAGVSMSAARGATMAGLSHSYATPSTRAPLDATPSVRWVDVDRDSVADSGSKRPGSAASAGRGRRNLLSQSIHQWAAYGRSRTESARSPAQPRLGSFSRQRVGEERSFSVPAQQWGGIGASRGPTSPGAHLVEARARVAQYQLNKAWHAWRYWLARHKSAAIADQRGYKTPRRTGRREEAAWSRSPERSPSPGPRRHPPRVLSPGRRQSASTHISRHGDTFLPRSYALSRPRYATPSRRRGSARSGGYAASFATSPLLRARLERRALYGPGIAPMILTGDERRLLKLVFAAWCREVAGNRVHSMRRREEREQRRKDRMQHAFDGWAAYVNSRRKKRKSYRKAARHWEAHSRERAVDVWRRFARRHRSVRRAITKWRRNAESRALATLLDNAQRAKHRRDVLRRGEVHWQRRSASIALANLRTFVFRGQRQREHARAAERFHARHLKEKVFRRWMEAAAEMMKQRAALRRAVGHWTMLTEATVFRHLISYARICKARRLDKALADEHFARVLAGRVLAGLREHVKLRQHKRECVALGQAHWRDRALLKGIARWRVATDKRKEYQQLVDTAIVHRKLSVMRAWSAAAWVCHKHRVDHDAAVELWSNLATQRAVRRWCDWLDRRRERAELRDQSEWLFMTHLARRVLLAWYNAADEAARLRAACEVAEQHYLVRSARNRLRQWAAFSRSVLDSRGAVAEAYNKLSVGIARRVVYAWRARVDYKQELLARITAAARAVQYTKGRRSLVMWRGWARGRVSRRGKVRAVLYRWKHVIVAKCFAALARYHKERRNKRQSLSRAEQLRKKFQTRRAVRQWRRYHLLRISGRERQAVLEASADRQLLRRIFPAVVRGTRALLEDRFDEARAQHRTALLRRVMLGFRVYRGARLYKKRLIMRGKHWFFHRYGAVALATWRGRVRLRRERRDKMRAVMTRWREQSTVRCFHMLMAYVAWRKHRRERYAYALNVYENLLTIRHFTRWYIYALEHQRAKRQKVQLAEEHFAFVVCSKAWSDWVQHVVWQRRLRQLEQAATSHYLSTLATATLDAWRQRTATWQRKRGLYELADRHYAVHVAWVGLQRWRLRTATLIGQAAGVAKADRHFAESLKLRCFLSLVEHVRRRRQAFDRIERAEAHLRVRRLQDGLACLASFVERCRVDANREAAIVRFQKQRHLHLWLTGIAEYKRKADLIRRAVRHWGQLVVASAFSRWDQFRRERKMMRLASRVFYSHSIRFYFEAWVRGAYVLKRTRLAEIRSARHHRKAVLVRMLAAWRKSHRVTKLMERALHRFRRNSESIVFRTWAEWTSNRIRVRAIARRVAQRWLNHSAAGSLMHWHRWARNRAIVRRVFRSIHVNTERRSFEALRYYVKTRRRKREVLDRCQRHADQAAARRLLNRWFSWSAQSRMVRRVRARWIQATSLRILEHWWSYVEYRRDKRARKADADAFANAALVQRCLHRWHTVKVASKTERKKERKAEKLHSRLLLKWVVVRWRENVNVLIGTRRAQQHRERVFMEWGFYQLRDYRLWRKEHHRVMENAALAGNEHVLRLGIRRWLTSTREAVLMRRVALRWQRGVVVRCFVGWTRFVLKARSARAEHERAVRLWSNILAAKALARWHEYVDEVQAARLAVSHYKHSTVSRLFDLWATNTTELREDRIRMAKAVRHAATTRMARGLHYWYERTASSKMRHAAIRRAITVWQGHTEGAVFLRWRRYVARRKFVAATYQIADQHHEAYMLRVGLRRWKATLKVRRRKIQQLHFAATHFFMSTEARCFAALKRYAKHRSRHKASMQVAQLHFASRRLAWAVGEWRHNASRMAWRAARRRRVFRYWRSVTTAKCWNTWLEFHEEARRQKRLKFKALHFWQDHLELHVFHAWVRYTGSRRELKKRQAARVLQHAWRTAVLADEHGLRDKLVARRVIRTWEIRATRVWLEKRKLEIARLHFGERLSRRAFDGWVAHYREASGFNLAGLHCEFVLLAKAFSGWVDAAARGMQWRDGVQQARQAKALGIATPWMAGPGSETSSLPAYSELHDGSDSVAGSDRDSASDWAGRIDLILNDAFSNALDHSASLSASGIVLNTSVGLPPAPPADSSAAAATDSGRPPRYVPTR